MVISAMRVSLFAAFLCAGAALGQMDRIEGERIRPHVRFLSHDLLEGRGVGQRGGRLAAEYIAAQFAAAGLEPGAPGGSYFQPVPLRSVEVLPGAEAPLAVAGRFRGHVAHPAAGGGL